MTRPVAMVVGVAAILAGLGGGPPASAGEPTTKTFRYKTTEQGPLEMVVHFPDGWKESDKRPAIVFFFGGGWNNGKVDQFETQANLLARRGMVALRADYRVKSRHKVAPDRCVEDAKSAIRWTRAEAPKLGIDPDRIVAAGGSAGGHIAACTSLTEGLEPEGEDAAISSKPNALVLFNPVLRFDGVPQLMARIGDDESLGKKISPTLHVSKRTPPTLLFYGTDDRLLGQGEEFIRRAKEVGFRAEIDTAEGQPHSYFNRAPWKARTTARMETFLASLGYLEPGPKAPAAEGAGWVSLFDGKNLDGWAVKGGRATYAVEDGAIVGTTVEGSPNTFLCRGDYRDFVLEFEVRCDPELNSGVQVRSHVNDKDTQQESDPSRIRKAGTVYGPQCEIARREEGVAGNFWDEARRTRWLDDWANKPEARAAFKDGEWNRYRIAVQGDRYRSWVNGVPCADFRDDRDQSGLIGLQVHSIAKGAGPYRVRWRAIRLLELGPGQALPEGL